MGKCWRAGGAESVGGRGGGISILCYNHKHLVRISTTSNLLNLSAYIEMLLSYSFSFFLPLHLNYKLLEDSNSMI